VESRDQTFDRFTSGLLPRTVDPAAEAILEPFRRDLAYIVNQFRANGASVFRNIYVGIADDCRLNAFAFTRLGEEYVAVNAGIGIVLPHYFYALLSHSSVLPHVGDVSREGRALLNMDQLLLPRGKFSAMDFSRRAGYYPQDEIRGHYAAYWCSRAWSFLIQHEIAHIVRCHLPYLKERHLLAQLTSGVEMLMEFGTGRENKTNAMRRVLESDADSVAVSTQVRGLLTTSLEQHSLLAFGPSGVNLSLTWEDVAYQWLVTIGLLFQLFAILDTLGVSEASRTHLHPDVRMMVLANFAWSLWREVISDQEKYRAVAEKARDDVYRIWSDLRLPISPARESHGYTEESKMERVSFIEGFEEAAARLNELTILRLQT
jgi:hypothetical protein